MRTRRQFIIASAILPFSPSIVSSPPGAVPILEAATHDIRVTAVDLAVLENSAWNDAYNAPDYRGPHCHWIRFSQKQIVTSCYDDSAEQLIRQMFDARLETLRRVHGVEPIDVGGYGNAKVAAFDAQQFRPIAHWFKLGNQPGL